MRLTIDRAPLAAALAAVRPVAVAGAVIPVLACVRLGAAADGTLTLTTTDREVWATRTLAGVAVATPGVVLADAAYLTDAAARADGDWLTLDTEDGPPPEAPAADPGGAKPDPDALPTGRTLVVGWASGDCRLATWRPDHFPAAPEAAGAVYEVAAADLARLVKRVEFAAQVSKAGAARSWAEAVLLTARDAPPPKKAAADKDDGDPTPAAPAARRLVAAASDTRQLATAEVPAAGPPGTPGDFLVPPDAVKALSAILPAAGAVRVTFPPPANPAVLGVAGDGWSLVARLIGGRFPPFRDIIPKKSAVKAPIVAGPFRAKLRQAEVGMDSELLRATFAFAAGCVRVTARAGKGEAASDVKFPLPGFELPGGEESLAVDMNLKYLLKFASVLPADAAVSMEMTDGSRPVLFRVGDDYQYLVMPMVG